MDIEEIRSSGLLELYAMDQLTPAEKAEVDRYLITSPELRTELREIERSLEFYAQSSAMQAPQGVLDKVLKEIRSRGRSDISEKPSGGSIWPFLAALFALGLLLLEYLFYQKNNESKLLQDELTALRDTCTTNTNQLTEQLNQLRQLTLPDNQIINFQATPGFAQTNLYLHYNKTTRRNFIQVRDLPAIADNQTFQLWSIKANQAPAPLDTFEVTAGGIVEVQFVEGTEVYAITIEPEGGSQSPTLENLIGTAGVAGL